MKASLIQALGTLTVGLFSMLVAPASAQVSTTANGPYYATPSWDQKITTNRFVILANWNNEAVLDRETGLVWQRAPLYDQYAFQAEASCPLASIGGRSGWRLPTLSELMSLSEDNLNAAPPKRDLPAGHPFTLPPVSADEFATENYFWTMALPNGSRIITRPNTFITLSGNFDNSRAKVWCVRGSL